MAQQTQVTEEQARARRGVARDRLGQTVLREGTVSGSLSAGADPPVPQPSDADEARTRAFLDQLQNF